MQLEIPEVSANAATRGNEALRWAVSSGHISVVNRLLEIPEVFANATTKNNFSLRWAAQNGHNDVVSRLLETPEVAANDAADDNDALQCAAKNGHNEVAYVLAELQWREGMDMQGCNPDIRACLPAICQGALIASGKKEAEAMVKCWVIGKPTGSSRDIHYPRHDQSSNEIATRIPSVIFTNIMQHAGYRNVVEEAEHENMVYHGMNALLYSRHLHKAHQTAFEKGQKESRGRAGYGEGAMVVYTPGNRNKRRVWA